jgi:hypothetical protein
VTDQTEAAGSGQRPPVPRWVKVGAVVTAVVVLLIGAALLLGGEHGPGRHGAAAEQLLATP